MNFTPDELSPLLKSVYDYWSELRPSPDAFPKRSQIKPHKLKALLPYIGIIEKREPDGDFFYRLIGTGLTAPLGFDPTGQRIRDVFPPQIGERLLRALEWVEANNAPSLAVVTFKDAGNIEMDYDRLILPLAEDGKTINMFLLAAEIKE